MKSSVLEDVTTWSLTRFETVRSWSLAEDLTPIEIADGYKLLGRNRRMTAADYARDRAARSLEMPSICTSLVSQPAQILRRHRRPQMQSVPNELNKAISSFAFLAIKLFSRVATRVAIYGKVRPSLICMAVTRIAQTATIGAITILRAACTKSAIVFANVSSLTPTIARNS
jgi:hypothetical protein